jgi:hypothetical protein
MVPDLAVQRTLVIQTSEEAPRRHVLFAGADTSTAGGVGVVIVTLLRGNPAAASSEAEATSGWRGTSLAREGSLAYGMNTKY